MYTSKYALGKNNIKHQAFLFMLKVILIASLLWVTQVYDSLTFAFSPSFLPELKNANLILKSPLTQDPSQSIWIAATGDIMFHSPQVRAAYDAGTDTYDFTKSFEKVLPYLASADFTLGNFETTTAGRDLGFSGYPAFNAPDETLAALKWAGYDYLSTANNHCLDRGIDGIERTIDMMDDLGLLHSGTFKQDSTDNPIYAIYDVDGFKIAILSTTYGCNGFEASYPFATVNQAVNLTHNIDLEETLREIESLGVDTTIVFIHWGNEYQRSPSESQRSLAEKMIENGADIILGSHPHVIQPSEIVYFENEPKYVIYSMGNFISNQSRSTLSTGNALYTENGVIVYLELTKDANGSHLSGVKHLPTWVRRYDENQQLVYEILPIEKQAFYSEMPAIVDLTNFAFSETMSMMATYDGF